MADEFGSFGPPRRNISEAIWRGARMRCPHCGTGRMFRAYLKVNDECPHCGEALHHHRADDAPPYVTIFLVGHLIIPLTLAVERIWQPDYWVHAALWGPLTLISSLTLLPVSKGALVALQWALYMHGFDPATRSAADPHIDPAWSSSAQ